MYPNETLLEPSDVPGVANAECGWVILEGPSGVAVTMTVKAAMLTAENLLAAAVIAQEHELAEQGKPD